MELNKLRVLTDYELSNIHQASLEVLSKTGMIIYSKKVLQLLDKFGAEVDFQKQLVKIPGTLVKEALASVPKQIILYNTRSMKPALVLGTSKVYAMAGGDATFFLDPETGNRRRITKADVVQFSRVADALDNISIICPAGVPQDVPPNSAVLHGAEAVFSNTEKPLFLPHDRLNVTKAVFKIASVVGGEEDLSKHPIMVCMFSPSSPLSWVRTAIDPLVETVKYGVPCCILPQPLCGVTAPLTLAGQLTLHNAEALSGILVSQLVKKGTPVIYGQAWSTFDMKGSRVLMASPEAALLKVAGAQLAKFYQIPSMSTSFDTDALCLDIQNGWEKMINAFATLAAGNDLMPDLGLLDADLTVSNEQLIIDTEILEILLRINKGIDVCPETVAVDTIQKVGARRNYLLEEHTLRHLRSEEHWQPVISTRYTYETWGRRGAKDLTEKAREKAKYILETHVPKPLDENKRKKIKSIIDEFESSIEVV